MLDSVKILLLPSEPVYSHVQKLKLGLKEHIGNYLYWDDESNISLLHLKIAEAHIDNFLRLVDAVIADNLAFDVTLNKIIAPGGSGLIFIEVEKSLPLRALTNSLHGAIKEYLLNEKPQYEDFEKSLRHQITIGDHIKGANYDKAVNFFCDTSLPESFECHRIVVYKEDPATKKNLLLKEFNI